MFVMNNFIIKLVSFINFLLTAYMWMVVGRAVISWVNADPLNPVVRFLYEVTEPVLSRIRRWVPISGGGIDFSPMILIFIIIFFQSVLLPTLVEQIAR
ncbi:MAG: YggT family protein [Deltaproteobacteria bacterium]|nr:YggT family protein [Deltaproteobacteria bacterium]